MVSPNSSHLTLSHSDFLSALKADPKAFGVPSVFRAAKVAWGTKGTVQVTLASTLIYAPSVLFGLQTVVSGRPIGVIVPALCILAFLTGRPDVSCSGSFPWVVVACAALFYGIQIDRAHLASNLLAGMFPLATYFAAGTLKGVTLHNLYELVTNSGEAYERLRDSGALVTRESVQQ